MWTLRQVYAKNLCAFKQLDYTLLQKHTTLIFGNNMDNDSQGSNGSGKSAMLEAIAIGITGETLRRIKMDEIINDAEDEATVSLLFQNNTTGQYLSIKRVISRKTAQIIKVSIYYDEIDCNIKHIEQAGVADYNKFILETLGLTKDDVGSVKFKDLNGDGYITEDDRTVIGNTNPKVQGGFGLSGQWKGFDFAMNFNFMLDFDVNNATAYQLSSSESNKNKFYNVLSTFADKGWCYTRDGDGECLYKCYYIDGSLDMYRELNEGRTLWNPTDMTKKITHSYFIEDGSFLRCQDLTVGYTLPGNLTSKWGISKARFYVSASNLFIITGYSGYDPEVDIQTGLTCGMDYNRYPRSRSFVLGTNITF